MLLADPATSASAAVEFLKSLAPVFLQIAPVVFVPLLAWLGKRLNSWIGANVKNQVLAGSLQKLESLTEAVVRAEMQTTVDDLKAKADAGQLNDAALKAELAKVKADAVGKVKTLMTPAGLLDLQSALGLDDAALTAMLDTVLEAVLHKVKLQASVLQPAAPATQPAASK